MTVNELIKKRRIELGLTLEDVASHVGVGKGTVQKWETGFIKNMRRDKMALLAEVLKIPPTALLFGDANIPQSIIPTSCPISCSEHEKELIKMYRCLPAPVRSAVDTMIRGQYELVRPKLKKDVATS